MEDLQQRSPNQSPSNKRYCDVLCKASQLRDHVDGNENFDDNTNNICYLTTDNEDNDPGQLNAGIREPNEQQDSILHGVQVDGIICPFNNIV